TAKTKTKDQMFYYKNNRLQQLRGFCYTAQFGNITRAAEHMGLAPSSVSIQIKALSEDLGVPLFNRSGPNISLTYQGQQLFRYSMPLIENIQNLERLFEETETNRVELNIAVNSTTLNFILPPLAKKFIDENPEYYLNLHYAEHDEAMDKLISDKVDLAIL